MCTQTEGTRDQGISQILPSPTGVTPPPCDHTSWYHLQKCGVGGTNLPSCVCETDQELRDTQLHHRVADQLVLDHSLEQARSLQAHSVLPRERWGEGEGEGHVMYSLWTQLYTAGAMVTVKVRHVHSLKASSCIVSASNWVWYCSGSVFSLSVTSSSIMRSTHRMKRQQLSCERV